MECRKSNPRAPGAFPLTLSIQASSGLIFEGTGRVFAAVLHYSVRHHAAHDFLSKIFIEEAEKSVVRPSTDPGSRARLRLRMAFLRNP